MTTDIRAALRDKLVAAFDAAWEASGEGFNGEYTSPEFTSEMYKRMRAEAIDKILVDATPTVAELLPRVDATHEVRWESSNLIGLRMRARIGARGELAIEMFPKICWVGSLIHTADLAQPATLVEVTP